MESGNHQKVQEEHEDLIDKIYGDEEEEKDIDIEDIEEENREVLRISENKSQDIEDKYYFAEEIEEEETLSLQSKELELIKKSLERHSGKRKSAAEELGISERTLYRKIKQYDL
jgi:transcriptional regulator with PAS, ATPase and Fis domain